MNKKTEAKRSSILVKVYPTGQWENQSKSSFVTLNLELSALHQTAIPLPSSAHVT